MIRTLAHLEENLLSVEFRFSPSELANFTQAASKIPINGVRYTGASAEQVNK